MDDNIFKAISKGIAIHCPALTLAAHDVLSDPEKRRQYDSMDDIEVDDSIPSESQADSGDFFEVFKPVFDRNSRFVEVLMLVI